MARKRFVVGNWKMYIQSEEEATKFAVTLRRKARSIPGVDVFLAPPFTLLPAVAKVLESAPIEVGAQTISAFTESKHTGDISGAMLKNFGASFVIIGHSERRAQGETDMLVREEILRASEAGLAPILCIGEREREEGGGHFTRIQEQLSSALMNLPPKAAKKLIVAYEPVWAIGKSAADALQAEDLEEMVIFIKKNLAEILDRKTALKIPILYGGSVEAENASELITKSGVSGFLVGHASTNIDSFLSIIQSCKK